MSDNLPHPQYRTARLIVIAFLTVFAVVYGWQCVEHGRAIVPAKTEDPAAKLKKEKLGNDFTAYYSAGEQARPGRNIYDWQSTSVPHRPYEYPPFFAVFPMMPLSYLPYNTALAFFYALNVLLLAASFWMLRKLLWPPLSAYTTEGNGTGTVPPHLWPLSGMLFALALSWRFIHSNTNESNANLYLLFLLTLALSLDQRWAQNGGETPRGGLCCGLAVALATAVKVTPGLFGVYFLWSLRRWAMLGGAIGLVLFLFVVPGIFLGWEMNLKYLDAYKSFALGKTAGGEQSDSDPNRIIIGRPRQLDPHDSDSPEGVGVSIKGMLTSLLTPSPALRKSGDKPRTVNFMTLDSKQVDRIWKALSLVLLLGTVALTFGANARQNTHAAALSWSLVTVAMTLISPMTRIAHLVVLAIPLATLVALLQQKKLTGTPKMLAWAAFILLSISPATGEYLRALGFTTFALIVLYVALASALRNRTTFSADFIRIHPDPGPNKAGGL